MFRRYRRIPPHRRARYQAGHSDYSLKSRESLLKRFEAKGDAEIKESLENLEYQRESLRWQIDTLKRVIDARAEVADEQFLGLPAGTVRNG